MKQAIKLLVCLLFFSFRCAADQKTFLVFGGKTGWIGQQIVASVIEQGHKAIAAEARLEDRGAVEEEVVRVKPDFIINAAGVTGRPNVDWCEDHKQETIRSNIIGALSLADIAYAHQIHVTNIGTGCIFEYDVEHQMHSGKGFTESDSPNFAGSFYSMTKIMLERLLMCYPNVLNLRLRMPISSDLNPRNFITKISKYQKVINIPNSVSILDDLVPLIPQMALRDLTGVYNFVNPGAISHNQILDLYKKYIDPAFNYCNFTVEEQNKILKAKRSNNELDASKLLAEFPELAHVQQSMIKVFEKMKLTVIKELS